MELKAKSLIKLTQFFFKKMEKESNEHDKLYLLFATIVFCRSIFHALDGELSKVKQLKEWWKIRKKELWNLSWHRDLKKLRDYQLKQGSLEIVYSFSIRSKTRPGKVKLVHSFTKDNKLEVVAKDYYTNKPIKLEESEVPYSACCLKITKAPIFNIIECCLADFQDVAGEAKEKLKD